MGASSLLGAVDTIFTVIAIGLVVITGTFVAEPYQKNIPAFNVLAALWALSLILAKRVYCAQMFSRVAIIHLVEIVTILKMLRKLQDLARRVQGPGETEVAQEQKTPRKNSEQRKRTGGNENDNTNRDVFWTDIKEARSWAPFFLVGLAITGYGMVNEFFAGGPASVFFLDDFGVCFIIIGLIVIIARSVCDDDKGLRAGSSLVLYILVLLVATTITGKIDPRMYYGN